MSTPASVGTRAPARPARRRQAYGWAVVVAAAVLTIMWVPIRRYALPLGTAFALEPYRVLFLALILGAFVALLSRTITWRPIRFAIPLVLLVASLIVSIIANGPRLAADKLLVTSISGLVNLLFVLAAFLVVRQAISTERRVLFLLKLLVGAAAVVSVGAVYERITRFNIFLQLGTVLPLKLINDPSGAFRGGAARAYGSAQHPIALAVLLCMILPIAVYLLRHSDWPKNLYHRRLVYGVAIVLLLLGMLAAISRTGIVVLAVMMLVTLICFPRLALVIISIAVPLLLAGIVLTPGTVDNTFGAFLDINSLIASQYTSAGWRGAGRLADLSPVFAQVQQNPFFGLGFSSRIVNGPNANADILDDQVLSILLEGGIVGLAGYLAFFLTPPILLLRYAFRRDLPPQYTGLAFALAISAVGYITGSFFYDAFGFMQTLYLLGFELAVAAWLLTQRSGRWTTITESPDRASSLASVRPDP